MNIDQERIKAVYRECDRSAAWLDASLLVFTLVLGLAVLYLCGALEWIVG